MAAGLGFKTFNTGDVLSASDVNGYLMQGVLVFADTTARDAAITSPQEGQFAFTKNNDSLWYYNGTSWVASGATGDIEGVTAGTGISGGGTSGTVTITNSMATAIDAKGDLIVGTGADTFDRLAVGTNGHTLVADSGEATGLRWAAPAGGGKVLQVVSTTKTDTFTTNNTGNWVDVTGVSVAITPSSATSKVLVLYDLFFIGDPAANWPLMRLMRDSTAIKIGDTSGSLIRSTAGHGSAATGNTYSPIPNSAGSYLDSPSTTSSTTYKLQIQKTGGTGSDSVYVNRTQSDNEANRGRYASTITVMEIGA